MIIVAVALVMLFIGTLFVLLILAYNSKKRQMAREKSEIQDAFDKQLLQSQLEIQESTFKAISEEIHDNVGQLLSFAKVQLNIMEQQDDHLRTELKPVKETIGAAFSALRGIAHSLHTERLQGFSLEENVRDEMRRMERTGIVFDLQMEGAVLPVSPQVQIVLFRIVQESLQNILKHAQATTVQLRMQYLPHALKIEVRDNGVGFSGTATRQEGIGLYNIRNRARLIGGAATISSQLSEGTTIQIITPYA